jgi:phospholipid/cholesterol/gamma-HCH transport system ATP-binding protein
MITAGENIKLKENSITTEPVVEIEHLFKSFGENKVLQDFDMKLFRGENVAVLGKSGSGKSVLIKCIIGLLQPESGSINVLGKNVLGLSHDELDEIRVKIGFLFQSNALYDSMTVRENLEFPLRRHKKENSKAEVNELVMEALTNVGLAHTVDMMPSELSGGMRKRIGLARTLILKPEIILYDEPTTGLDPVTGRDISHLILEMQKKYNTSSLIISHDMNCIKITANRIITLIDGRRYADNTYEELKKSNDNQVNQFFE